MGCFQQVVVRPLVVRTFTWYFVPTARENDRMHATEPWTFGLDHLLILVGFAITLGIAGLGFRSFENWKREKVEERRIDVALESLAVAYDAERVFDSIRSPMSFGWEWSKMKGIDDPDRRSAAGPFFAILNRLDRHKEYFERVVRMQPRFMAAFGKDTSSIFRKILQARRDVEVSAEMLLDAAAKGIPWKDPDFEMKLLGVIWGTGKEDDPIKPMISAFVEGIERNSVSLISHKKVKRK